MLEDKEFGDRLVSHQSYLMGYAISLCKGNRDYEPEDLLQDTNLRAWERRSYYKSDDSMTGWLCFMMHNIYINSILKCKVKLYREDPDSDNVPIVERYHSSSSINHGEGNMTLDAIDDAISSLLNPMDRDIVQRYISGETHGHIGSTYNMKDNAIKQRYFHAIKVVREHLVSRGVEFDNYVTPGTKTVQSTYRKKQSLMEYKVRTKLGRK